MSADIYLRKCWLAGRPEAADARPEASGLAVDGRVEDGIRQFRIDHVLGEFRRDTAHGRGLVKLRKRTSKLGRSPRRTCGTQIGVAD